MRAEVSYSGHKGSGCFHPKILKSTAVVVLHDEVYGL